MDTPLQIYHNVIEPQAFASLFLRYPPVGFACSPNSLGLPVFSTKFDLLTTLDPPVRARLSKLPFFKNWSKLLNFHTSFVGSTITEYLPLPQKHSPEEVLQHIMQNHCEKSGNGNKASSLIIFKDLPSASPLLDKKANATSHELACLATAKGFISVEGQALAYVDINFENLDEYMAKLSASRRKDMRRKLKKREQLKIETMPLGDAAFENSNLLETMYNMYLQVFEQSEIHFDLLSKEFFCALLQSHKINGLVVFYQYENELAGYNICLINNNALIDKYIGFNYPLARELNLYFVSWFYNLELALQLGLKTYVAGWTDPEVKKSLGASFTLTRHLVYVKNPILRAILSRFKGFFESDGKVYKAN